MPKSDDNEQTIAARKRLKFILEDGRDILVDRSRVKDFPEWFDEELFKRGQKWYIDNLYTVFITNLIGLLLVLSIPTVCDVVVLTNKSNTPCKAYKRYFDTLRHSLNWYTYDIKDFKSESQKSISIVHGLHGSSSRLASKHGLGARVTQTDMSLSQFVFMGLILVRKKELSINCTDEDEIAIIHLWRTLGYFLGIQDRFNLCQGTSEEVRNLCQLVLSDVYAPYLKQPPRDFDVIARSLIDGFKPIIPIIDVEVMINLTNELCGLPNKKIVSWYNLWLYNVHKFIHNFLFTIPWLRSISLSVFNILLKFSLWLNSNFPIIAAIQLGQEIYDTEEPKPLIR
ncbi:uncharacterized protein LOC126900093 [Daktulosphaira vitifoliae]|uniref:uncharacterized protein LOC126900093 n=1 Tax=Daktulosphaira vitifoliae TaxID=58002 RepID=UPI0021A9AF5E|nr:uncharacterized protein LOC126900093 [Daktulosphaira vitifoliae]